jgi:hypothetical protein
MLPALSTHIKVLRNTVLISERKECLNRSYFINEDRLSETMQFFDLFLDRRPHSLMEYVENNDAKRK